MRRALFATLFALAVFRCSPQESSTATPVIRTESRLVLVDAIVADKQGSALGDLTAGDFRLWEDGREQHVQSASFGGVGSGPRAGAGYVLLLFGNTALFDDAFSIAVPGSVPGTRPPDSSMPTPAPAIGRPSPISAGACALHRISPATPNA